MISIITVISVIGVAAGVMALVVALAVTNGFRNTLQRNMLGAMAHIDVMNHQQLNGIENWRDLAARVRKLPHVTAVAPALYMPVFLSGPVNSKGVELKGIDVDAELPITDALKHLKAGSLDRLRDPNADPPGIVLGSRLAADTGMVMNSRITLVSPEGNLTPFGMMPTFRKFYIVRNFRNRTFPISTTAGRSRRFRRRRRRCRSTMWSTRSKSTWTILTARTIYATGDRESDRDRSIPRPRGWS